jgi:hypothetical protein
LPKTYLDTRAGAETGVQAEAWRKGQPKADAGVQGAGWSADQKPKERSRKSLAAAGVSVAAKLTALSDQAPSILSTDASLGSLPSTDTLKFKQVEDGAAPESAPESTPAPALAPTPMPVPAHTPAVQSRSRSQSNNKGDVGNEGVARKLPLPEGWAEVSDKNGKMYYWNRRTNETSWTRPEEQHSGGAVV